MSTRIEVDDRAALAMLERLRASGADPLKLHEDVGAAFVELVGLAFNDGADPWGNPWEPLSDVTVSRRRKGSSMPLRDTGMLRASVESRADASGVEVSIGRADRPAAPHQFGNPSNRMFGRALAPIPARPMLPLDSSGVRLGGTQYGDALVDLAEQYLAEATA